MKRKASFPTFSPRIETKTHVGITDAAICLYTCHNGEMMMVSSRIRCRREHWDKVAKQILPTDPEADTKNGQIKELILDVHSRLSKHYLKHRRVMTLDEVKETAKEAVKKASPNGRYQSV